MAAFCGKNESYSVGIRNIIQTGSYATFNGRAVADFRSGEPSYGDNRFQHLNQHGKPPELNHFNESSEILGGLVYIYVCIYICVYIYG